MPASGRRPARGRGVSGRGAAGRGAAGRGAAKSARASATPARAPKPAAAPRVRPTAPLIVAFVPGVTPTKWQRVWADRMRATLDLRALDESAARAGLADGSIDMAFLRFAPGDAPLRTDDLEVIPLYDEVMVVVAAKDSPIAAFDELALADLEGESRFDGEDAGTAELAASGAGIAVMPQSVARIHSRRDAVARPITDAPRPRVGLVWRADRATARGDDLIDAFIGIVRGRTGNSSR